MKKDTVKSKTGQLSEEDLYGLDEEYAGDYNINNINTSAPNFNSNNLYQNYQGRLGPLAAYPQLLYAGMPPIYPYGLGLPQAGKLHKLSIPQNILK